VTPVDAARRLGVHETAVRTVVERENDAVATLRDGTRWLISDTVSRPYVAEVDDEIVGEAGPELFVADADAEVVEQTRRPAKRTQGKAK